MEYQYVIAQQRDHIGAYYNLAQALFRLKKPEEGKRAMEIYRSLNAIAQEIDTRERAILIEPSNPLKAAPTRTCLRKIFSRARPTRRLRRFRQP